MRLSRGLGKVGTRQVTRIGLCATDFPPMDYAVYLLYRTVIALIAALPLRVVFSLGRALGTLGCWLAWPYRRLVLRNLTIAFGDEKSPREIRQLAREHFATLAA